MKKIILAAIISLLTVSSSYSQTAGNRGYLGISVGPSFPVGNYGRKNLDNSASGFAKTGETVAISYAKLTGKHFGFAGILVGQLNPLDTKAMENSFSQMRIPLGIWSSSTTNPPPGPYTTYPNWKIEKKSWLAASLLAGGYGEFSSGDNFSFTVKAMAGVVYASSPAITGSSITDTAQAYYKQSSKSALGMSYLTSGGIKYNLSKKISLLTNVEYFATSEIRLKDIKTTITTFKGTPGSPDYSAAQSIRTADGKQTIGTVNVVVGIGISL
jgi:hypothetical protein